MTWQEQIHTHAFADHPGEQVAFDRDLFDRAFSRLEQRQRDMLEARYRHGLTQKKIAGEYGLVRVTVGRNQRAGLARYRSEARRLHPNAPRTPGGSPHDIRESRPFD